MVTIITDHVGTRINKQNYERMQDVKQITGMQASLTTNHKHKMPLCGSTKYFILQRACFPARAATRLHYPEEHTSCSLRDSTRTGRIKEQSNWSLCTVLLIFYSPMLTQTHTSAHIITQPCSVLTTKFLNTILESHLGLSLVGFQMSWVKFCVILNPTLLVSLFISFKIQ